MYINLHPYALDLLKKMLIVDPVNRITIEECLLHEYFKIEHFY